MSTVQVCVDQGGDARMAARRRACRCSVAHLTEQQAPVR
ncbi:Uncharacterised protein [Bordetella pertussis]|nr:Uncharacterised protein [Bordetella pertussis]